MKIRIAAIGAVAFLFGACMARQVIDSSGGVIAGLSDGFPPFITPNDTYFEVHIAAIPEIDGSTYRLRVTGAVQTVREFSLEELYAMESAELTLTVECIGNGPGGRLVATAVWGGIPVADLLDVVGVGAGAVGVEYRAADGYFTFHTMEEIREQGVLFAVKMNGEPLPVNQGFPARALIPGYHGVRQPAWVTEIRVVELIVQDYWERSGWRTREPMAVDSVIFLPEQDQVIKTGESTRVTGAAFGGGRIASVDVTADDGLTWVPAHIARDSGLDHVWVFWEAEIILSEPGKQVIRSRATDSAGRVQMAEDPDPGDGVNSRPSVYVRVE